MKDDMENEDPNASSEATLNQDAIDDSNADTNAAAADEEESGSGKARKKPRVPKAYPCARIELYPIVDLMWNSCNENLAPFTAFSPSYDEALMTERLGEVVAVRALPDETDRSEAHRSEHVQLEIDCLEMCEAYQLLKRYIVRAKFVAEEAKLDLAGQKYYLTASNFDWNAAQALATAAKKFLVSHLRDLTENRNMPETFPAKFNALAETFNGTLLRFSNFEKVTEELTDRKMMAENDLYFKATEMGKDGQTIFKKDPAKARLFSFNAMWETVSGIGSASLKGLVADEENKQPIANATISVKEKTLSATTNKQGKYDIGRLASGTYTVMVNAPGYLPVTITGVVVEPGISRRENVQMKKG